MSIERQKDLDYHLIIVNNGATDRSLATQNFDRITWLETGENLGFGAGCNLGLQWVYEKEPTALVWLINPDAYLPVQLLMSINQFFQTHSNLSIVGTIVQEPDGKRWFSQGHFNPDTGSIISDRSLNPLLGSDYLNSDWVTGCSMILNLQMFPTCPHFDPAYFLYYEDFDFCQRYRQHGHQIVVTDRLFVIHEPSSITNRNLSLKLTHSTYSYLLSLKRHSSVSALLLRFLRLSIYALVLVPVRPAIAVGKLAGIWMFLTRGIHWYGSTVD
jgi:GT2 family glycosyltransferase